MPRRPLSAYNFFFSEERVRVLAEIPDPGKQPDDPDAPPKPVDPKVQEETEAKSVSTAARLLDIRDAKAVKRRPHRKSHGKIAFKDLARTIGKRWRELTEPQKTKYNELAEKDLQRYNEQMKEYNSKRNRYTVTYQTAPGPLPPQINAAVMNLNAQQQQQMQMGMDLGGHLGHGHAGHVMNVNVQGMEQHIVGVHMDPNGNSLNMGVGVGVGMPPVGAGMPSVDDGTNGGDGHDGSADVNI